MPLPSREGPSPSGTQVESVASLVKDRVARAAREQGVDFRFGQHAPKRVTPMGARWSGGSYRVRYRVLECDCGPYVEVTAATRGHKRVRFQIGAAYCYTRGRVALRRSPGRASAALRDEQQRVPVRSWTREEPAERRLTPVSERRRVVAFPSQCHVGAVSPASSPRAWACSRRAAVVKRNPRRQGPVCRRRQRRAPRSPRPTRPSRSRLSRSTARAVQGP